MAAEKKSEQDEIAELKVLMQKNAEALEKLRSMVENLQALLSIVEPPASPPEKEDQKKPPTPPF